MKSTWHEVASAEGGPGARSSHAIAVVGRTLFLYGGEIEPRVPVDNAMHCLDLDTLTWHQAPANGDVPAPRVGVCMVALGPVLFVFGGRDAEHTELSELYSFDTLRGVWQLLSAGESSPPARSYHAMSSDPASGKVFLFGGCGAQGRRNDLWAFDVAQSKWDVLPPPGSSCVPRGGAGLVCTPGAVWVLFGFCGHELSDVHRFDTSAKVWQEVTQKGSGALWPAARSVFGAATFPPGGSRIVVYGGEKDPSDLGHEGAGKFLDDVLVFDANEQTWSKPIVEGAKIPGPRGWFPAAATESGLVIYGGNSESNDRLGDIFILKLEA